MSQNHKVFTCLYKHTHTNETRLACPHQVDPFLSQRLCTSLLIVEIPVLVQNDRSSSFGARHLQPPPISLFFCTHTHSDFRNASLCMWLCHTYHSDRCRALHSTVRGPDPHSACFDAEVLWVFSGYVLPQLDMFLVTTTLFSVPPLPQQQHSSILSTCSTAPSQSSALGTPVKPWRPATRTLSPSPLLYSPLTCPGQLVYSAKKSSFLSNNVGSPQSRRCIQVHYTLFHTATQSE